MNRVAAAVAPARLGVGFRWLLASSSASNLCDGIADRVDRRLIVIVVDVLRHRDPQSRSSDDFATRTESYLHE